VSPAKWTAEPFRTDPRSFTVLDEDEHVIVHVVGQPREVVSLIAAAPELYAALAGFLSVFWPTADEGHTGFVDRLGMQFYEETGIWPPFKSSSMEVHVGDPEVASKAWRAWLDAKRDAAAAAAVAAVAKVQP
jgi:hypothetical protein